jgi:hypothetical protein
MVKNRLEPRMFDAVQQAAGFVPKCDKGFATLNARTTQHQRLNGSWRFLQNNTAFAQSISRASGTAGLPLWTGYR